MTQATVSVGGVEIRGSDGAGFIHNLSIANPSGFRTSHALKVAEIEVVIDIASVTRDVVVIRRIAIKSPDIIYERSDSMAMTNFDAIQKNIAAYLGPTEKNGAGGKKLIVEELTIRNAGAHAGGDFMQGKAVTVNLPDITLYNLGKAKGGMSPGELGQEIAQALKQRLVFAIGLDGLSRSAGRMLGKAGEAIKGLFGKPSGK